MTASIGASIARIRPTRRGRSTMPRRRNGGMSFVSRTARRTGADRGVQPVPGVDRPMRGDRHVDWDPLVPAGSRRRAAGGPVRARSIHRGRDGRHRGPTRRRRRRGRPGARATSTAAPRAVGDRGLGDEERDGRAGSDGPSGCRLRPDDLAARRARSRHDVRAADPKSRGRERHDGLGLGRSPGHPAPRRRRGGSTPWGRSSPRRASWSRRPDPVR